MVFDGLYQFLGTIGIAKYLVQTVYNQNLPPNEHSCFGTQCFGGTHVIVSLLCFAGAASLVLVSRRVLWIYQRIWAAAILDCARDSPPNDVPLEQTQLLASREYGAE